LSQLRLGYKNKL